VLLCTTFHHKLSLVKKKHKKNFKSSCALEASLG